MKSRFEDTANEQGGEAFPGSQHQLSPERPSQAAGSFLWRPVTARSLGPRMPDGPTVIKGMTPRL